MAVADLTAQRLRELFHYDPETGEFTYLGSNTKSDRVGRAYFINRRMVIPINGDTHYRYRLAWLYMTGFAPKGQIDHIDGDRTNDRFCNLRDVSQATNLENSRKARVTNKSSGLLGAYKNGSGWHAKISVSRKVICLGTFRTAQEAHAAYLAAKRIHHKGCTI